MDHEDPDSAAAPLESGIIFLTDEDLATAERQFLDRQRQEAIQPEEAADPSLPDGPLPSASREVGEPTATDSLNSAALDSASPDQVGQKPATLFEPDSGAERHESESDSTEEGSEELEESSLLRGFFEWVMVLVGAIVVAMLMRAFLFQAFMIPSESMEGTLQIQDRVMVNRVSYHLHGVNRGDVVVFTAPPGIPVGEAHLIKRVIGLAGETIEGRDNAIFINGQRVAEPYLDPADTIFDFPPVMVPEGTVFVMGDNRDDSGDSRIFGPIDTDTIVGRAFVIYWPLDRLDGV